MGRGKMRRAQGREPAAPWHRNVLGRRSAPRRCVRGQATGDESQASGPVPVIARELSRRRVRAFACATGNPDMSGSAATAAAPPWRPCGQALT